VSTENITREQMEYMREECNKAIDAATAMDRLQNNADFKQLFIEGYMKDNAARLVGLLGDQTINLGGQKAAHREDIQERLIGISRFGEHVRNIYKLADQAMNTLESLSEAEAEFNSAYDVTAQ
jgi:hypothetical protein